MRVKLLGLFLLFLIAGQELTVSGAKIEAGVMHRKLSDMAHGLVSVAHHAERLHKFDHAKLPRDRHGNVLLAMPDENGEWRDSQADLFDPENQAKMVAFLQSAAWTSTEGQQGWSLFGGDSKPTPTPAPKAEEEKSWWGRFTDWTSEKIDSIKSTWDAVTGREIRDTAEKMDAVEGRLAPKDGVTTADVIGAIAFGLVNGIFMGMADFFRDNIRAMKTDENCTEPMEFIKESFKRSLREATRFGAGLFDSNRRNGMKLGEFVKAQARYFFDAVGDTFLGFSDLISLCQPLRTMFGAIFMMILIGIIVTIVLFLFPGLGPIIKIIGMILTLIFGLAFVIKTAKKFIHALGDRTKQGTIDLIEASCEFIGFLIAVFIISGVGEAKKNPQVKEKFDSNRLAKKENVKWDAKSQKDMDKLENAIKASKDKSPKARQEIMEVKNEPIKSTYDNKAQRWREVKTGKFHKGPGAKFDPKTNRWRGADGKFVKQPENVWPKWDAKVQRWRDETGKFHTSPIDKNIKWDSRESVMRFRDQTNGRFAKTPENNFYLVDKNAKKFPLPIEENVAKPMADIVTPKGDVIIVPFGGNPDDFIPKPPAQKIVDDVVNPRPQFSPANPPPPPPKKQDVVVPPPPPQPKKEEPKEEPRQQQQQQQEWVAPKKQEDVQQQQSQQDQYQRGGDDDSQQSTQQTFKRS